MLLNVQLENDKIALQWKRFWKYLQLKIMCLVIINYSSEMLLIGSENIRYESNDEDFGNLVFLHSFLFTKRIQGLFQSYFDIVPGV